jgi:outer membrane receptor protein involved in Fe transport
MANAKLERSASKALVSIRALAIMMAVGCIAAGSAASAQKADDTSDMGDIIVTAQKRAAHIQDVPLSIAAIDGEALENRRIQTTSDLARVTPGLAVSTSGPGQTQIIIRGISSTSGSQATTGYYLDEVPVSALSDNIEGSTFDLDRVEVLRGPQGTLYGSASMGGAIKYISNQPNDTRFEARGSATLSSTAGSGANYEGNAVINVPLAEGVAALRVMGFYKKEDGYIDRFSIDPNNYLAADPNIAPKKNANSHDIWGVRAAISITPTETLRLTPSIYYQKLKTNGLFAFDEPPGSYKNLIQTRSVPEFRKDDLKIYNLTATQELGNDWQITSSSSYFDRRRFLFEDMAKVIFVSLQFVDPAIQPTVFPMGFTSEYTNKIFTQEVRATGNIGPVELVLGAFFQDSNARRNPKALIPDGYNQVYGTPFPGVTSFFTADSRTYAREYAGFGQAIWSVSDRLRLTAGLRAFKVEEQFNTVQEGLFFGAVTETSGSSSSNGLTPKFAVDFDVTDDILAYASAAKGFRAGGGITPVPQSLCAAELSALGYATAPNSYDPDSLWSYEAGIKSQFADKRVTLNASAYHIDWSRIQQTVGLPQCGFSFTANFGASVSRGLELESRFRVTDALTVGANFGYTDTYLKETVPGTTSQKGDRLLNVPKYTLSLSLDYSQPVSEGVVAFFTGNYSYVSDVLAEYSRASLWQTRPSYELVNLQMGVGSEDDRWRVALFADNLFNEHATVGNSFSTTGVDLSTTRALAVNRPRTIGVNVKGAF